MSLTDTGFSDLLADYVRAAILDYREGDAASQRAAEDKCGEVVTAYNTLFAAQADWLTAEKLLKEQLARSDADHRAMDARCTELQAELASMQADGGDRYVQQLVDETRIRSLEMRNGKLAMDMEAAREITAHFVAAARAMLGDAPNYAETKVSFDVKVAESPELYTLVVQRHKFGCLTPHEARLKAEAEAEQLRAQLAEAEQALAELKPERSTEYRVITWDWREQPDFAAISSAFTELSRGGTTYGYNVDDTGCDEYAVVISTVPLDGTGVQSVFDEHQRTLLDAPEVTRG